MNTLRRVGTVAAIMAALAVMTAGIADPAAAQSPIDDMIQGPDVQDGVAPTVAERYPTTSYRYPFHGEGISIGARSSEVLDQGINAFASFLIGAAAFIAQVATRLVQWAFDPTATSWLLDAVEDVVRTLMSEVWGQAILTMAAVGALVVAFHGVATRRATKAAGGAVWIVAVIAAATVFAFQPRTFIETPHELTTEISAGLFGAVAGAGTTDVGDYYGDDPPTFNGPPAVDAQRRLEDMLWRVAIYEPWRMGTFPSMEYADEYGESLLADRSADNVADIYDAIAESDEEAAEFFAGREPGDRVLAALMTFLASLPIAVTMIVLGSALIVLQFAFTILSMLAPLFLLLGVNPGAGRTALLRWIDMWLGTLVKRVAITALMSGLVALFAFAARNLSTAGWFLTSLLTTLVCVAALIYRRPIVSLLAASVGMVGSGAEGEREHAARNHPGSTAARVARNVKVAGIAGAAAATVTAVGRRRDRNDDGAEDDRGPSNVVPIRPGHRERRPDGHLPGERGDDRHLPSVVRGEGADSPPADRSGSRLPSGPSSVTPIRRGRRRQSREEWADSQAWSAVDREGRTVTWKPGDGSARYQEVGAAWSYQNWREEAGHGRQEPGDPPDAYQLKRRRRTGSTAASARTTEGVRPPVEHAEPPPTEAQLEDWDRRDAENLERRERLRTEALKQRREQQEGGQ